MNQTIKGLSLQLFAWAMLAIGLTGCGDSQVQRSLKPVPTAFGDINKLQVICDESMWKGPIGDTIDFYYSSAYPIMPQPEPILDLGHFTPAELNDRPMRKEMRTYMVVANLADEDSPTTRMIKKDLGAENIRRAKEDPSFTSVVGQDKWAKGQLVVYQFAFGEDKLQRALKKNLPAVLKRIRRADEKKIEATVYLDGEDVGLSRKVRENLGLNMRVPKDYQLAVSEDRVMWLRKETDNVSSNILLYKVPYREKSQLSKAYIKEIRDSLGKEYISTTLENTYMQINDEDLPMFVNETTVNNNYALEARGIWEIVNDYMGGPFISFLIHNPQKNELLFADGFVFAPGEEKRNFIMYLEYIIETVRFDETL